MTLLNARLSRRQLASTFGLAGLLAITGPGLAAAQRSPFGPATPASTTTASEGPLGRMLSMVPQTTLDELVNGIPWTYVDLAGQFAALSMHHDLAGPDQDEPIGNAALSLVGSSPILAWGLDEELIAAIGFHPLGLNQILYVGDPGSQVQLFAAPFDSKTLHAVWAESGYERVETFADFDVWTSGPEGEVDFEHPVQSRLISSMNNLALVDDVVIATPTLASLQGVLDFMQNGGDSLLVEPTTASLVASLPGTIASAIAFQPAALALQPLNVEAESLQVAEREAIRAELGPMPIVLSGISAVDAGAYLIESDWSQSGTREETVRPDAGTAYLRLATASSAEAAQALSVVEQR
ncbi:MAG TPA: hypothetical protein VEW66_08995, partial [Thermomicrobiales bacterium]|nr:hypothetical protein [Thermomicrobiales bacterium]